jgi:hypothetical protein
MDIGTNNKPTKLAAFLANFIEIARQLSFLFSKAEESV